MIVWIKAFRCGGTVQHVKGGRYYVTIGSDDWLHVFTRDELVFEGE